VFEADGILIRPYLLIHGTSSLYSFAVGRPFPHLSNDPKITHIQHHLVHQLPRHCTPSSSLHLYIVPLSVSGIIHHFAFVFELLFEAFPHIQSHYHHILSVAFIFPMSLPYHPRLSSIFTHLPISIFPYC
jgi:hypothetical protein